MPKPRQRKTPLSLRLLRATISNLSRVAPSLTAKLAFALWHYPRRHDEPRREQRWRETSRQRDIDYLDGHLTLYEWGDGNTPVLLVHGWDGRGPQLGAFVEPLVAAGYSPFALDLPAHGRSSGKRTNMLESAAAINHAGKTIGPLAAVIAHSFGAGATAKALADGLQTDKAVLISSPANLHWLTENYYQLLGLAPRATRQLERLMQARYGDSIWQDVSPDHNLGKSGVPGIIVHDREDRDVPFTQGEILVRAWPRSRLLDTNGLGHRRILRDAEVIRQCIDFIAAEKQGFDQSRT